MTPDTYASLRLPKLPRIPKTGAWKEECASNTDRGLAQGLHRLPPPRCFVGFQPANA